MGHDLLEPILRHVLQCLGDRRVKLARVKRLARHDAQPCHLGEDRCIGGGGRVVLHQGCQEIEIGRRVESVDLFTHRRLHVDARIDLARRRRVRFLQD